MPDILVGSSTGTRPSVTGLSDITQMSDVQRMKTREIPIGFIKAKRYTAVRTIKVLLVEVVILILNL